jgi:hypothetical protein
VFGLSNPFHNEDLVDSDSILTRDENGEDPAFNQLGPTGSVELAGDHEDDDGSAQDDKLIPNPQGILGNDGIEHGEEDDPANTGNGDQLGVPVLSAPTRAVAVPFGHAVELTDQDQPSDVQDETTRILNYRVPIGVNGSATFDPQMLFPPDPNRQHLILYFDDTCQWGNTKTDVSATMTGGFPGGLGLVLDKHTGAVWVYSSTAASGSYAYAWAVTR